jgi:hypothetical protein
MSDLLHDNNSGIVDALDDELDALRQEFARYRQEADWRLERLEKLVVAGKAATILDARTVPVSSEMSATGRSDFPQQIDSQTALINARSGLRQPNKPTIPGYGKRP